MKMLLAMGIILGAVEATPIMDINSDVMIDYINTHATTWKSGRNFPQNTHISHIRSRCGVAEGSEKLHKHLPQRYLSVGDLPEMFDAREKWPNCPTIKEIRDQGACGSSWAVAAVEAMSDRVCIASVGAKKPHLSAEDPNNCCHLCGGCYGGFPAAVWIYYIQSGIVTGGNYNTSEGCLPYSISGCAHYGSGHLTPCNKTEPTPHCHKKCEDGYNTTFRHDKHHGKSVYSVSSKEDQIMTEIMNNGPVEATFNVYSDFPTYKSGVYNHTTGDKLGQHAVKILGWGIDSGIKYWLVANSWNTDWGDKGFFKIVRGENVCHIESQIVAGEPNL